jgi:hypothetical protein
MAAPTPGSGRANPAPAIVASILAGAGVIAVVGTLLPGWAGITGAPAVWIPVVFYAVALADIAVAAWLWRKLKALRRSSSSAGGPVQRQ